MGDEEKQRFVEVAAGKAKVSKEQREGLLAFTSSPGQDGDPVQLPPLPTSMRFCLQTGAQLALGKLLGQGTYGRVHQAVDEEAGQTYALKIAHATSSVEELAWEHECLKKLQHPNLIQVYGLISFDSQVGLLMEIADGKFVSWLREHPSASPVASGTVRRRWQLLLQGISGLVHVHSHGMLHCDVKPNNVLVHAHPENTHAKLADFGMARVLGGSGEVTVIGCNTYAREYRASELILAGQAKAGV